MMLKQSSCSNCESNITISYLQYHFSNIIFKINELDLFYVLNVIALGIQFIFGTKFSWNEGIDTYFNVEYVLRGRNFDYFGGYLVVSARYLVVPGVHCQLLVVTACYHSFCINVKMIILMKKHNLDYLIRYREAPTDKVYLINKTLTC